MQLVSIFNYFYLVGSKLYGVNATIMIFVFVLYCICIVGILVRSILL